MAEDEQSWEEAYAVAYARVEELEAEVGAAAARVEQLEAENANLSLRSAGGGGGGDMAAGDMERLILSKEALESANESLKAQLFDLQLKAEAEVLEKELDIVDKEKTILMGGDLNMAALAAQSELNVYKEAIGKLKEMFGDTQNQLRVKEGEADEYLSTART
eukprot:Selendium_serpulae@DN8483_c0_g1_i1.p1